MKEALTNILNLVIQQSDFLKQISADVCALKSVVCALSPETKNALDEQLAVERNKIQSQIDLQKKFLQSMSAVISKIPN